MWKKQIVKPNRILWTKGKFIPAYGYKDWVHVDDLGKEFEVGAKNIINTQTLNGHFRYFKTKQSANKFAKRLTK